MKWKSHIYQLRIRIGIKIRIFKRSNFSALISFIIILCLFVVDSIVYSFLMTLTGKENYKKNIQHTYICTLYIT